MWRPQDAWLAAGVRTPFSRVDGALQALDPLELSVPVARHMAGMLKGGRPDFAVWGVVVPKVASCSSNPRKRRLRHFARPLPIVLVAGMVVNFCRFLSIIRIRSCSGCCAMIARTSAGDRLPTAPQPL